MDEEMVLPEDETMADAALDAPLDEEGDDLGDAGKAACDGTIGS